jgi:hypothetical protein
MPPEVFNVWNFPTSNTVQHPSCTGAQGFSLTLYMLTEVVVHCSHLNFINFYKLQMFLLPVLLHQVVVPAFSSVMLDVAAC